MALLDQIVHLAKRFCQKLFDKLLAVLCVRVEVVKQLHKGRVLAKLVHQKADDQRIFADIIFSQNFLEIHKYELQVRGLGGQLIPCVNLGHIFKGQLKRVCARNLEELEFFIRRLDYLADISKIT